jgi:fused signal recognition particle receptor
VFWRRKPRDEEESPAEAPGSAAEGSPERAPDWEPDPADFEDPIPPLAEPPAPAVEQPAPAAQMPAAPAPPAPAAPAYPGWPVSVPEALADTEVIGEGSLEAGVARSRGGFVSRLRGLLGGGAVGGPSWDEVEETLIGGDVGAELAIAIVERARARHDPAGNLAAVRAELAALLAPRDPDWRPMPAIAGQPAVVLVVGVNGTGKTTTIGKLASRFHAEGLSVILAAADTFRAAAIEQLAIWATRSGSTMVAHAPGADPGAVVYDALDAAVARKADMVIADTAGRLHTKVNLMDELAKVRRIIDKRLPGARPEVLFVLDATTGQNGLAQARAFNEATGLTGIVLTKLDSTAKGGIVFAIEADLGVPVRFVGVGEQVGDLLPFDPEAFVAALFAE